MRFTDHSRTETDQTCPRARYWGYDYNGHGLNPIEKDINLTFGDAMAQAAEAIRHDQPVKAYGGPLPWAALYAGLTEAYRTRIWPQWCKNYRLIATEVECTLPLSPDVTYMARPDAVVQRVSDDTYWYIQDKTSSLSPDNFGSGWDKLPELHATAKAVKHTPGYDISGAIVQGWYKGYLKNNTLYSPLAYCWVKLGQPGVSKPQLSLEYRAGWSREPITKFDAPAWVKSLPEPIIQQQFPVSAPIMIRPDLADTYLAQVLRREEQIRDWADEEFGPIEHTRNEMFPQHFHHCDEWSKYRRPCAFRDCCWAPTVGRDPIGSGLFIRRVSHHAPERDAKV